ncbi:MAG: hypothetical protein WCE51_04315 [Chthoniobacterales bacterium]|jgi:hypothetical protein
MKELTDFPLHRFPQSVVHAGTLGGRRFDKPESARTLIPVALVLGILKEAELPNDKR